MQQFALSMPQHYDKIDEIIIIHILNVGPSFPILYKKSLPKMLKKEKFNFKMFQNLVCHFTGASSITIAGSTNRGVP
jgi:hypothetical protein